MALAAEMTRRRFAATQLRGILFDLDQTLIDRGAAHAAWVREVAPPEAWAALIAEDRHGYRERDDYFRWVAAACPDLGDSESLRRDYRVRLPQLVPARPQVVALLRRLAPTFRLGLVTNGGSSTQRAKLKRAGLDSLFPRPVISGELGAAKPAPEPFAAGLADLGLSAAETLFVGDDPERDIAGAQAAGLQTCWISHGRDWPRELPAPTRIVGDLADLEEALGRGELKAANRDEVQTLSWLTPAPKGG